MHDLKVNRREELHDIYEKAKADCEIRVYEKHYFQVLYQYWDACGFCSLVGFFVVVVVFTICCSLGF